MGLATLVEQGGRTTLTMTLLYDSQRVRDAVLKSPMQQGVVAGLDKLSGLLAATPVEGVK